MDYQSLHNELKNINGWVFDLDDTLYPANSGLYSQISKNICAYVMKKLNLDEKTAFALQKEYYHKYGATIRGLMMEHNVDPKEFAYGIQNLDLSPLKKNPQLKKSLQALPGKKVVYTNGAPPHAEQILDKLGLTDCFEGVFSIWDADFIPKPDLRGYSKMLKFFDLNAEESIMFDDSPANILGAKKAGMHTVWISSNVENNKYCSVDTKDFCDYETKDVMTFLSGLLMDKSA